MASPWPFGSVHPATERVLSLLVLGAAALAFGARALASGPFAVPSALWPLAGLLALAALQLVPLPDGVHLLLGPGSATVWHPAQSATAAVLGDAPRPVSVWPDVTRRWLGFAAGLVGLAVAAWPALRERRPALHAALATVAGGLAVAVYGVVARTTFGNRIYGIWAVPTVAPFGPFVSKNHFAGYVEMAALLALGLAVGFADQARRGPSALSWIDSSRANRVVVSGGVAAAMALAVLLSQSRGGALSLATGLLSFVGLRAAVRRRRHALTRRRAVAGLAAATVAAALALAVLPAESRERLASLAGIGDEASGRFRFGVWRDTLRLAAASPLLGHGLGAYEDALPRFKTAAGELRVEHAENEWLELLAEGGLVGLGLAVAALALAGRSVVAGLRRQEDPLRRGLGLGATAGVVALLAHGAFDFNLRIPSNALLFVFLSALALAVVAPPDEDSPRRRLQPSLAAVTAAALAAVVLLTPAATGMPAAARAAFGAGASNPLRRARAEEALCAHVSRRPADAEAWLMLAWLSLARGSATEGAALARHAMWLDPRRAELRDAAQRLAQPPTR